MRPRTRRTALRRMFFETLESRQMLTLYPLEPTIAVWFSANEYPAQVSHVTTSDGFLSPPASGDKFAIGMNYLRSHAQDFGVTQTDLNNIRITNQYTGANGISHLYIQQMYNGLPIANAVGSVHISPAGRVISADLAFVRGLTHRTTPQQPNPAMDAMSAVSNFATKAGVALLHPVLVNSQSSGYNRAAVLTAPDLSDMPIPVEMHYVPAAGGGVQLAWKIVARLPDGKHWYDASIGADSMNSGQLVQLANWVDHATYNVYAQPTTNPLDGPRTILTDPHDPVASPFGWHDTNGVAGAEFTDTRGNNVSAQEDRDNNNTGGFRPDGTAALAFDFPIDLTQAPTTYESAAITNLFYWNNVVHDVSFHHGFDEVSGNFQTLNYSGQGLGNDAVQADAQDGSGTNNANFATPPDGIAPRMQQYIFDITNPARDSDLMGDIIAHEFGHGISNRLTGGPANAGALQCLQSGGMGEGWSDWFGLVLDLKPGEDRNTPQPIGNWVLGQPTTGPGIRAFPYSYDMSINPLTLGDYNANQQVHFAGTIWSSALWDLTWLLIGKHGNNPNLYEQTGGQNVAMNLILEGMKLQPANPTFLDARDAILAADLALYGGDNYDEIWDAFARRGYGLSASIGTDCDSTVVVEAFDRPPPLARVRGTVFHDVNSNLRFDATDLGLAGWTVYVDANNNATLDVGEKSTVTGVDGTYQLSFFGTGQVTVRQVVMQDWKQVFPQGNGGAQRVTIPGRGLIATNVNFGNQELPGEIHGLKYNDLNANGLRDLDDPLTLDIDETEPGIPGVVIFVDLNDNDSIGILEPAAVTDRFGRYTIKNIQPGTYTVRETLTPGMVLTQPSPLAPFNGEYSDVVVVRNTITPGIDFGNTESRDWGDAPTAAQTGFLQSYPTTAAQNGARHGILPGFGLGVASAAGPVVDGETDGRPTNGNSTGDDIFPAVGGDDENGIQVLSLNPTNGQGVVRVNVSNGPFAAGYLQGWFDWNRDGDWNDAGEHAIVDQLVREGNNPTLVTLSVPNVAAGITYARFRYGYDRGAKASPVGPSVAGEVEDYQVNIAANVPVANDDEYGTPGNPPVIRVNQPNNIISYPLIDEFGLSVLGNDTGTVDAQGNPRDPRLNPASFLIDPPDKGTVTIGPGVDAMGRQILVYTPAPGQVGADFFLYQAHDGAGNLSNVARVDLLITSPTAIPVDDFVEVVQNSALAPLNPLDVRFDDLVDNDEWDKNTSSTARIVSVSRVTPNKPAAETFNLTGLGPNPRTFNFQPAPGFTGTVVYRYELDDNIASTPNVFGTVTIQVGQADTLNQHDGGVVPSPPNATAPSIPHYAMLDVDILDLNGGPLTRLGPGQEFLVRVTAEDLAGVNGPFAGRGERGVQTAYIDLLFDESIATPVSSTTNPLDFNIIFNGKEGVTQTGIGTVSADASNTRSAFTATGLFANVAVGHTVRFTSGPLTGQQARITAFNQATGRFTLDPSVAGAFTGVPAAGNAFVVESALYNTQQLGEVNFPLAGQIDEVGGFRADSSTGAGPQTVFTIRFQVHPDLDVQQGNPLQFQVIGDPADNDPTTEILLTNRPNFATPSIAIDDENVFIDASGVVDVKHPLDAEFSNSRNPLDVNDDDFISPSDALLVIDDLNANGSRQLSQADIAISGIIPIGYLDVNSDSHVAAADALMVIDHLNFSGAGPATGSSFGGSSFLLPPAGGGEGETGSSFVSEQGEGEAGPVFVLADSNEESPSTPAADSGDSDPLHQQFGNRAASAASPLPAQDAEEELELYDEESAQAADELFADLGNLLE